MHRLRLLLTTIVSLVWLASNAGAQTPTCEKLRDYPREMQELARELLDTHHLYDCCDDTIAKCLKRKPTCALAYRLAENICRRVSDGQRRDWIIRALARRAEAAKNTGHRVEIDLDGLPIAGSPSAPITLVEYACPRCPYCARISHSLHRAVVEGPLKGKVKLYYKLFPIRYHPHAKESSLAFLAAAELGHFWEYLLYFYDRFDQYSPEKQLKWAREVGMDVEAFEKAARDPATRELLVKSKIEGIVNQVDATPTFFLNGRKYTGELSPEEFSDFLEEEYERIQGIRYLDQMGS